MHMTQPLPRLLVALTGWLVAGGAISVAPPAFAQTDTPPAGCTAFLTVQYKSCAASLLWRCSAAPDGTTWEATFGEEGASSVATFNKEFQWLDTYFFFDGSRERMFENGPRPALLSELIETGENAYEFTTIETSPDGDSKTTYIGIDRLTGTSKRINDEELLVTEFASVAVDAETREEVYRSFGNQYVLASENLILLGTDTWTQDGITDESNYSPVEILRPGMEGFGDTKPKYDCGVTEL
ncbi:MAG: hypothetical protein ACI9IV_000570 [Paracoccaceae bacterium]